ncbi:hypothetical protein Efla_007288 [Eimeria flavescens]
MGDVEVQVAAAGTPLARWDDGCARSSTPLNLTIRVSVHLCCTLLLGAFILGGTLADPPVRGFFCDDQSIRMPLKAETVPATVASVLVIGLPLLVFAVVETLHAFVAAGGCCPSQQQRVQLTCCSLPLPLRDLYVIVGGFAFSLLTNFSLATIAKLCIGRLRPHFLAVCQPDWAALACSDATGSLFVQQYECKGADAEAIREARLSFFSAHSSNALCAMLYATVYLQQRLGRHPRGCRATGSWQGLWHAAAAFRPFLQTCLLLLAFFIALSRIMDFFHHPSDVLTGLVASMQACMHACMREGGVRQQGLPAAALQALLQRAVGRPCCSKQSASEAAWGGDDPPAQRLERQTDAEIESRRG